MAELIINDDNWTKHIAPVINGQRVSRGYSLRDYANFPPASFSGSQSWDDTDLELIPRDAWDDLAADMESEKSRLSDIRMQSGPNGSYIPSLDQDGQGFSHTADTEVLTDRGWVPWPEYDGTDLLASVNQFTGLMEFQTPTERHGYEYHDEMYYSTNRRLDFGVTKNHRMFVRKWDERKRTLANHYTFQRADELGWYVGMMHAPAGFIGTELIKLGIVDDRNYDGDDLLALLAVIVSDGYASNSESDRNLVSFCCFHKDRYPMVSDLAYRCGFNEQPGRPGVWSKRSWALSAWIKSNCYTNQELGARNKQMPMIVKCASVRQINHFLKFFGDKNHGENSDECYYSTSKRLIDDLQELLLRVGRRSSISKRPPRSVSFAGNASGWIHGGESYSLNVSKTTRLCIERKKHIEHDHYDGLVYCATVPNGTLITRRNGSILISGNCWAYSSTMGVMLQRAVQNLPYKRLSAHAVACKIYNFQDRGAWGALSLDFIRKNGVPDVDYWKEKSMDRRYDKAETWENAKQYQAAEGWLDLNVEAYDAQLTEAQIVTCLLNRIPVIHDFAWWGHSVIAMDYVIGNGRRILNSWTDSYGEKGMAVITGSKVKPMGACAVRSVVG